MTSKPPDEAPRVEDPSADSPGDLQPGARFGGYRIVRRLGAGGMGVVYEATQLSLERPVALKLLSRDLAGDSHARERFIQEGALAARVAHPHLVKVLDVAEVEGRLLLAHELVRGGTLADRLRREGPLPVSLALEVAAVTADVLITLHGAGILHRDLKPANLFLSDDRGVLLGDLGIAKDLLSRGPTTHAGMILGTPAYMPPECVEGRPPTPAWDLYALGVVLYECLTGAPPFASKDLAELLRSHVAAAIPSVCARRSGLAREFDAFFWRALAKTPDGRFASARDFASAVEALSRLRSREDAGAPGLPPAETAAWPTRQEDGEDGRTQSMARRRAARAPRKDGLPGARSSVRPPPALGATHHSTVPPGRRRVPPLVRLAVIAGVAVTVLTLLPSETPPGGPRTDGGPATADDGSAARTPPGSAPGDAVLAAGPPAAPERDLGPSAGAPGDEQKAWLVAPELPGDSGVPELSRALDRIRAGYHSIMAYHREQQRSLRKMRLDVVVDRTVVLWQQPLPACIEALEALARPLLGNVPGAHERAARLLSASLLLGTEAMDSLAWTGRQWEESIESDDPLFAKGWLENQLLGFPMKIGRGMTALAGALEPVLPGPGVAAWMGGLGCVAVYEEKSRPRGGSALFPGAVTDVLADSVVKLAGVWGACDFPLIRGVARALRFAAGETSGQETIDRALAALDAVAADPSADPRHAPSRVLARYDLELQLEWIVRMQAAPQENTPAEIERGMDAWVEARNRLIRAWPYDPRRPPPAGDASPASLAAAALHSHAHARLFEIRGYIRTAAGKLHKPVPEEPRR